MEDVLAAVIYQRPLPGGYFRLGLETGWKDFIPGQFSMLQVPPTPGVLLRRPFSLARQAGAVTEILYKAVGKGTVALSRVKEGQGLKILGPLGRGFREIPSGRPVVGVAGGYGIAPFWEMAFQLKMKNIPLKIFYGARSAKDLVYIEELESLGVELHLATEDGSRGHPGVVTDLLERHYQRETPPWVGACGPMGLLYAVARWCQRSQVPCQLAVEEIMGCGTGVCLGCVVRDRQGGYRRACVEGPVFSADTLEIPS